MVETFLRRVITLAMDHQMSGPGPDWSDGPKEEPEDDSAQTVENQSTDECDDMKELDMPFINITPIDTNQVDIYKIEDTPKPKLEIHKISCPLYEPQNAMKCENDSATQCSKMAKEPLARTTSIVQNDDGFSGMIEVSGEIDRNADDNYVPGEIRVGSVLLGDVEQEETTQYYVNYVPDEIRVGSVLHGDVEQEETTQDDAEYADGINTEGMGTVM